MQSERREGKKKEALSLRRGSSLRAGCSRCAWNGSACSYHTQSLVLEGFVSAVVSVTMWNTISNSLIVYCLYTG